jgi:hypothetical protein
MSRRWRPTWGRARCPCYKVRNCRSTLTCASAHAGGRRKRCPPPEAAMAAHTRRRRPRPAADAPGRPRRARNGPIRTCPKARPGRPPESKGLSVGGFERCARAPGGDFPETLPHRPRRVFVSGRYEAGESSPSDPWLPAGAVATGIRPETTDTWRIEAGRPALGPLPQSVPPLPGGPRCGLRRRSHGLPDPARQLELST